MRRGLQRGAPRCAASRGGELAASRLAERAGERRGPGVGPPRPRCVNAYRLLATTSSIHRSATGVVTGLEPGGIVVIRFSRTARSASSSPTSRRSPDAERSRVPGSMTFVASRVRAPEWIDRRSLRARACARRDPGVLVSAAPRRAWSSARRDPTPDCAGTAVLLLALFTL